MQRLQPAFILSLLLLLCSVNVQAGTPKELKGLAPYTHDFPTPAMQLKDIHGQLHDLKQYRGKIVVLNFWATWCAPCREEMPSFQQMSDQLPSDQYIVIGVNVGEQLEQVLEFLHLTPLDFPILLDEGALVSQYWPMLGLPTTFIIDRHGEVRYTALGPRDWVSAPIINKVKSLAR